MNARFWEYINGTAVKLTLRPGQVLRWRRYIATEEGYFVETQVWEYLSGFPVIECRSTYGGRDCDGQFNTYDVHRCSIPRLQGGASFADSPSIKFPPWITLLTRDHRAEAAGY